jgi:clan AA aspartic protease
MGLVYAEITLKNTADVLIAKTGIICEQEIRQVTLESLVDTGAWTLVINEALREKLGLDLVDTEPGTLADGTKAIYDVVGPVDVMWKNRKTTCTALVLPNAEDVLLGAIPLEAMDLTINPRSEELVGAHGDQIMHLVYMITQSPPTSQVSLL